MQPFKQRKRLHNKTELRWQLNKYGKPSESSTTGKYYKIGKRGQMKGKY